MSSTQNDDLAAKLKSLRDVPAAEVSNQELFGIYKFLVPEGSTSRDTSHWFCSQATPVTVEAATFLLRLHAYNSAKVANWRKRLQACLGACPQCVKRLQELKETSRQTCVVVDVGLALLVTGVLQILWSVQ